MWQRLLVGGKSSKEIVNVAEIMDCCGGKGGIIESFGFAQAQAQL